MTARKLVGSAMAVARAAGGLIALGYHMAPRRDADRTPPVTRTFPTTNGVTVGHRIDVDPRALRAEIRAAVHDEMASAATAPSLATPHATADQQDAAARAHALVDDAIARGRWSDRDADAIRSVLASADFDDAMDVRLAFARAVNEGRLTVDGPLTMP